MPVVLLAVAPADEVTHGVVARAEVKTPEAVDQKSAGHHHDEDRAVLENGRRAMGQRRPGNRLTGLNPKCEP